MPLYPYRCLSCGHEFEEIQKYSDPLIEACPECGGKTEKQVALSSFALRGGGWYQDGYAEKKKTVAKATKDKLIKENT